MNPNAQIVASNWPALWRAGLLSVAMPASDYDKRSHSREAILRDLARRAKAYAAKKKGRKK